MITAEQSVKEILGTNGVMFEPSLDEKADAPRSVDVSVASKTLAKRGKVKFLKGLALGTGLATIVLPLGILASGWVGETLATVLLK